MNRTDPCERTTGCECHACRCSRLAWAVIMASAVIIALCTMAWLASLARGDGPEPPTPRRMGGEWSMHWGGSTWATTLGKGGKYRASDGGTVFVGTWKLAGDTLTIVEAHQSGDGTLGAWVTYVVTLERGKRSGASDSGTQVRFERVTGPKS